MIFRQKSDRTFPAHGLVRGDEVRQLRNLDSLLLNGIDSNRSFHAGLLRTEGADVNGFRASTPFLDGGFVALSGANQDIARDGIKYVLVNEHFVDAIGSLQKRIRTSNS